RSSTFVFARAAAAIDDNTAGVLESNVELLRCFVKLLGIIYSAAAGDFDWTGVVGPHAPLRDVEMMRAPIGHLAAGVIPEETKEIMDAVLVISALGGRPEPHVVVQVRRWLAVRYAERIGFLVIIYAGQTDFDRF